MSCLVHREAREVGRNGQNANTCTYEQMGQTNRYTRADLTDEHVQYVLYMQICVHLKGFLKKYYLDHINLNNKCEKWMNY